MERSTCTAPYREVGDFVSLLELRARETPTKSVFQWLDDGDAPGASHTYASLDRRAREIAIGLEAKGLRGGRALLVQPPGLTFVESFFGCLYAGVTAVPLCPPRPREAATRIAAVAMDAGADQILTAECLRDDLVARLAESMPGDRTPGVLAMDRAFRDAPASADRWTAPGDVRDHPAFLQYTSGSTGAPKGVVLTHRALLHNGEMLRLGFDHTHRTRIVSWLPLFHDMGLIGQVLQAVYCGGSCVLMSPQAFVMKPARWLRAISAFEATTSGAPNFAYDLCTQRVLDEEMDGVDLSRWRVAFNGAEPVRAETMQRFTERFARWGFRRRAFYPCYGLAEATLFSTGGATLTRPAEIVVRADALAAGRVEVVGDAATIATETTRTIVSCGRTRLDQEVAIVDPESGVPCAVDRVGEIWLRSGSVGSGYWGKPEESERIFRATPMGSERRFLRTGDLGFMRRGELFVTGRVKDVIIIAGRNHYPHDVEATVGASHRALRAGHAAAFSVEANGVERLIVVQEVERTAIRGVSVRGLAAAARAAVLRDHDVRLHTPVFVKPGGVPRTSSGKIRRSACRERYLRGDLRVIGAGDTAIAASVACGTSGGPSA